MHHLAEHPCAEGMQPARPPPHACAAEAAAGLVITKRHADKTGEQRTAGVSRSQRRLCADIRLRRSEFAVAAAAAAAASSVFAEDSRSRHGELSLRACSIGLRYFLSFCVYRRVIPLRAPLPFCDFIFFIFILGRALRFVRKWVDLDPLDDAAEIRCTDCDVCFCAGAAY